MKKFFLLLAAAVCSVAMSAKMIYLDTNGPGYWGDADYSYFIWSWGGTDPNAATPMTHIEGNIFYGKISDEHDGILFVRMPFGYTEINWDDKIDQTLDYTVPTDGNNLFTITGWVSTNAIGNWTTYTPSFPPVCSYSIKMTDSYGDGWNGGYLTVEDHGIEQTFTLGKGSEDWATVNAYGGTPHWTWTAGSYVDEVGFGIVDVNGVVLAFHRFGTPFDAEFTIDDPCATRTVPADITGLVATEGEQNHYLFTWDASSDAETYNVQILNPIGSIIQNSVVTENELSFDFSKILVNGDYSIKVFPADAYGVPYVLDAATLTITVTFPALGDVKIRFYVPEYSEIDMSQPTRIRVQGTNNAWLEAEAIQEDATRWWSATLNVPDPAISYVDLYAGTGIGTDYGAYLDMILKENNFCLQTGDYLYYDAYGDVTIKWYNAKLIDCDAEVKDYSIASATLVASAPGELTLTVDPKENEAAQYRLDVYTGPTDALEHAGYVTFIGLTDLINWYIEAATDITYWTVTPLDEYKNVAAPAYESYEVVTVQPSPYVILSLDATAVGDNTYKITWDYSDVVPEYYIYVEDPNGRTMVSKYVKSSELAVEGDKFVFITPAFGAEGQAYVYVSSVDEDGDERYYRYLYFDVSGLIAITDAKIRVLIPTDNNMDISNGVWFWWWPAGTTTGSLVKATEEGGRWFSADIKPNATGYQFLVVNKEIKSDEDWTGAQQSDDSPAVGAADACFALASKYTFNSTWGLYATDCSAADHDYRPTLTFDNSVAKKVTVSIDAAEYAPKYQMAWRVKDSGDGFSYSLPLYFTSENHTYTMSFDVTEDTEYDYRFFVNDEDWNLMVGDINGTFTVKAAGEKPDYHPTNLSATVDGRKVTFTWNAPVEVELCIFDLYDGDGDVVFVEVTGDAGLYTYEYTFAEGDERTLNWAVYSRIGSDPVSGWVYGTPVKAATTVDYSIENLTAVAATDNCYKISWDVKSGVYQFYILVEDHNHNAVVDGWYLASDLTIESGKYVLVTPAFAVEGEASAQVWSADNEKNQQKSQKISFDVSGLSKLTTSKIRVLIPTDNNMDITGGVWFWWWKVGEAGQIVKATNAGGQWFEAEIEPNAAGYKFLVVNKEIKSNADWTGAQQSEDSPIITEDEACFEQLYTLQPANWVLAADDECDNADHDYRFTVTTDNSVAGRLTVDFDAVDYAPVYRVGVAVKEVGIYSWTNLTNITASNHSVTLAVGMPEDTEYIYRVYAYNNDKWQLTDRVEGEVTILANADVPVDLKAEVNGKDVTFSWTPRGTAYTDFRLKIYDEKWTLYFDEGYIAATTKTVTIEDNGTYHWALDVYGSKEFLGGILGPDFTVNYVPVKTYTLSISADAHGKVNDEVNGTYNEGESVKIIATPNDGYEFDKWSDGDTHATRTITMDKDYDLTAYFVKESGGGGDDEPEYYTLTVVVEPKGKATVYFDGETVKNNKLTVEEGTSVTLTFEEEEGFEFDYWEDGKSTVTKAKYKVTVDEDKTVVLHLLEAQDIHNVEDVTTPTKFLRDGTIYILRDGTIYTVTGQAVQ